MQESAFYGRCGAPLDCPGLKLWVVDTGGAGVPVVLLHPNSGTSAVWENQIAALVAGRLSRHRVDRRGWGKSVPIQRPAAAG